ncbi:PTS system mannose/fructose/sorbose family transporter subunit IID [Ligilactobacillus sp. WILCCON 0076]|uniref:PTS system mannose/fructose/sorbose family transporter subunit IID n=1 Tax=Ligilactobacillus ubinensis TaxID=2876789 RepID=A0A9X2FSG3_9LACO|nr:PTS system mannose/fructose/sorbose family transporter subunit IID [Ligilactobacillus ubinensis]MCP0888038.1 PTS system mannose/fructose/sorbose family transporter subunit IID [Ligilactobacillus ubinensis]
MNEKQKNGVLTKKDLIKTSIRHYIGISTYNYDSGMASTVVWEQFPALRKIYKDDDELVAALDNHFKFYNCHPWLSAIITGATLAMEEKDGIESKDAVQNLKAGLMGPFSGIGDTITWVMLPTILGAIAGSMGKQGNAFGMWLFVLVFATLFVLRSYLYIFGYNQGVNLITNLGDKLNAFTDAISVLGLTVIGGIISSTVNFKLALSFNQGGVKLSGQSVLNELMPSLLPVALVGLLYWMMKKGFKMTTLILAVIVIAMLGAAFGIFKV